MEPQQIGLAVVVLLVLVALVFDFMNGFHDAANSIATIVSTRVLKPHYAVIWVAAFNFAAVFIFHLQVAATIGRGIVDPGVVDHYVIFGALVGAIAWNLITWYYGIPSSSSHALIGGLVGAAVAKAGAWALVGNGLLKTVAFIFISPVLGFLLAAMLMIAVSWLCVRTTPARVDRWFRRLQLISASLYSLGHGGSDAQKTMGVILLILVTGGFAGPADEVPMWVVVSCYVAIALGTLFGGWRSTYADGRGRGGSAATATDRCRGAREEYLPSFRRVLLGDGMMAAAGGGTTAGSAAAAEHRRMLADSVADFVARGSGLARVRKLRGDPAEHDRAVWKSMADLGWLGILVPERYGGLGLGLAEMAIVAQGLARGLAPEPLAACAVLATGALLHGENEALKERELPRLAAGEALAALAWQEDAGTLDPESARLQATPFEGGYKLNGTKRFIAGAAQADAFLVTAQTRDGLALFWVPRDAAGTTLALEPLADGRASGTLTLADALVPRARLVAHGAAAGAALGRALDHARAIAAAELCGVMGRALEMTLDYLRTRVQFGKIIGTFQALQHRAVDLHIHKEIAAAVLEESLAQLDCDPDAAARAAIASRVKARCADAAAKITRETIQMHGAIGFTDEFDAGLYLKRALTLAAWLGSATAHRRRYARLTSGAA